MAPIVNSRKRTRSENGHYFETQSKQFISEQIAASNDANKMKEIHEKTIKILFQSANVKTIHNNNNSIVPSEVNDSAQLTNKWQKFGDNICLMGNGEINYITPDSKIDTKKVLRRCHLCAKPSTIQAIDCVNCNLELCEYCGISCMQCNSPLCISCIQLFGCCDNSVDMNACCLRCKQIYNIQ